MRKFHWRAEFISHHKRRVNSRPCNISGWNLSLNEEDRVQWTSESDTEYGLLLNHTTTCGTRTQVDQTLLKRKACRLKLSLWIKRNSPVLKLRSVNSSGNDVKMRYNHGVCRKGFNYRNSASCRIWLKLWFWPWSVGAVSDAGRAAGFENMVWREVKRYMRRRLFFFFFSWQFTHIAGDKSSDRLLPQSS